MATKSLNESKCSFFAGILFDEYFKWCGKKKITIAQHSK
jgi:hypothetical protein